VDKGAGEVSVGDVLAGIVHDASVMAAAPAKVAAKYDFTALLNRGLSIIKSSLDFLHPSSLIV
jgi:hypothetical protein